MKISGAIGWLVIVVYVAAWDGHPRTQTLSDAFYKAWSGNSIGKVVTLGSWAVVTVHLFYPMKNDPINLIGRALGKLLGGE